MNIYGLATPESSHVSHEAKFHRAFAKPVLIDARGRVARPIREALALAASRYVQALAGER
jgi:hypothetical protein